MPRTDETTQHLGPAGAEFASSKREWVCEATPKFQALVDVSAELASAEALLRHSQVGLSLATT